VAAQLSRHAKLIEPSCARTEGSMTEAQLRSAFEQKVRAGVFRPVLRYLVGDPDGGEDRLQDATCQVWEMFRRYGLDRKVELPTPILVHACRLRAVDRSRHFAPRHGAHKNADVFSEQAYRQGRVEVLRLEDLEDGLAEVGNENPERNIQSGIDLVDWTNELGGGDRTAVLARMIGEGYQEIAERTETSCSGAFQRVQKLGHELAERTGTSIRRRRRRGGKRHHVDDSGRAA
jgi:DNA-directed RNA polymerase specialized sigma24 family protein